MTERCEPAVAAGPRTATAPDTRPSTPHTSSTPPHRITATEPRTVGLPQTSRPCCPPTQATRYPLPARPQEDVHRPCPQTEPESPQELRRPDKSTPPNRPSSPQSPSSPQDRHPQVPPAIHSPSGESTYRYANCEPIFLRYHALPSSPVAEALQPRMQPPRLQAQRGTPPQNQMGRRRTQHPDRRISWRHTRTRRRSSALPSPGAPGRQRPAHPPPRPFHVVPGISAAFCDPNVP